MEPDNNMTSGTETPTQTPTGAQQAAPATTGGQEENAWGPMIGVIVIVLLLVAGGFYYYMQESSMSGNESEESTMTAEEQAAQDQADVDAVAEQSTSSAFSAIEADFNATDATSLDNTLNSIDSELGL